MKKIRAIGCLALAAACLSAVEADAQDHASSSYRELKPVLTELSQSFVCPQFLPDDAARAANLSAFNGALATIGPKRLNAANAAYIYRRMLDMHNCGTMPATASAEPAAESAPAPTVVASVQ